MTKNLKEAQEEWLNQTCEEEFYFKWFPDPTMLRRHNTVNGALAALEFGKFKEPDGNWIDKEDTIWLQMITSDKQGDGERLLELIKELCTSHNLIIYGELGPLKPKSWAPERLWHPDKDKLVDWYRRRDFEVLDAGKSSVIVRYPIQNELSDP